MLMPKRVKWRKQHRGRMRGVAQRGNTVTFGEYGLQALERGWVSDRQIEAARVAMTRHLRRGGKVWIKIFPDKPVTKKPAETRMGAARAAPSTGWRWSSPGACSSRSPECPRRRPARRCGWPPTSCPSRRSSSPARWVVRPMKARELRELSDEELAKKLRELKEELFNLRFQAATGQLDNPMRLRQVRRDIARVQTIQRERELAALRGTGSEGR